MCTAEKHEIEKFNQTNDKYDVDELLNDVPSTSNQKRKSLGRGLNALMGDVFEEEAKVPYVYAPHELTSGNGTNTKKKKK